MTARRVIANLDAETEWAEVSAEREGRPPPRLSQPARATIAALGTLMRVVCKNDSDALWTPLPVDPLRMVHVDGLPRPKLESGPLSELAQASATMVWCTTPSCRGRPSRELAPEDDCPSLVDTLWKLPPPELAAAETALSRRYGTLLANSLEVLSLGSRWIKDDSAWRAAANAARQRWVLKAPLSASGRDRVIGTSDDVDDPTVVARVSKLLGRHGALLFEPWCDRIVDFGVTGLAGPDGAGLELHYQLVDRRGAVRSLHVVSRDRSPLAQTEHEDVLRVATAAGGQLYKLGYRGPFGIDGFVAREPEGDRKLVPMCEVNTRWTMGWIARFLAARLQHIGNLQEHEECILHLGMPSSCEGQTLIELLRPAALDKAAAYIEIR